MTDQVFRIIIAVAVGLACIMVVVQAFVMLGLLRVVQKIEQRVHILTNRAEPVVENLGTIISKLGPIMQDASPVIVRIGPMIEKIGAAFEKVGPIVEKVGPVMEKITHVADNAGKVLTSTNRIIEDARPRVSEISSDVAAISRTGREQVDRISGLIHDAGDRAQSRLEQIDHTVESTVGQIEQAGDAVKRTVMRPVREVNGIAAGISAAVGTLVGKPRKYSVDSATQDEEMFI